MRDNLNSFDVIMVSPNNDQFPDLQKWITQTVCFTFAILDGAFEHGMQAQGMGEF